MAVATDRREHMIKAFNHVLQLLGIEEKDHAITMLSKAEAYLLAAIKAPNQSVEDRKFVSEFLPNFLDLQLHPLARIRKYCTRFLSSLLMVGETYIQPALLCLKRLITDSDIGVVQAVVDTVRYHVSTLFGYSLRLDVMDCKNRISDIEYIRNEIKQLLLNRCSSLKGSLFLKYKLFKSLLRVTESQLEVSSSYKPLMQNDSAFTRVFQSPSFDASRSSNKTLPPITKDMESPRIIQIIRNWMHTDIEILKSLFVISNNQNPMIYALCIQCVGWLCSKKSEYLSAFFDVLKAFCDVVSEEGVTDKGGMEAKQKIAVKYILQMELLRIIASPYCGVWSGAITELLHLIGKEGTCEELKYEGENIYVGMWGEMEKREILEECVGGRQLKDAKTNGLAVHARRDPDMGTVHMLVHHRLETISWLATTFKPPQLVKLIIQNFQSSRDINLGDETSWADEISAFSTQEMNEQPLKEQPIVEEPLQRMDDIKSLEESRHVFGKEFDEKWRNELKEEIDLNEHKPSSHLLAEHLTENPSGPFLSPNDFTGLIQPISSHDMLRNNVSLKHIVFSQMLSTYPTAPPLGENVYLETFRFHQRKSKLLIHTIFFKTQFPAMQRSLCTAFIQKLFNFNVLCTEGGDIESEDMLAEWNIRRNTTLDLLYHKYAKDVSKLKSNGTQDNTVEAVVEIPGGSLSNKEKEYYTLLTGEAPCSLLGWKVIAGDANKSIGMDEEGGVDRIERRQDQSKDAAASLNAPFYYSDVFDICLEEMLSNAKRLQSEKSNKFAQLLGQFILDVPLIPSSGFTKIWSFAFDNSLRRLSVAILSAIIKRGTSILPRKTSFCIVMHLTHNSNVETRKFFLKLISLQKGLYVLDSAESRVSTPLIKRLKCNINKMKNDGVNDSAIMIGDDELFEKMCSRYESLPRWQWPMKLVAQLEEVYNMKLDDHILNVEGECSAKGNDSHQHQEEEAIGWNDPSYFGGKWIEDCAGLTFRSIVEEEKWSSIPIQTTPFVESLAKQIIERPSADSNNSSDTVVERSMLFVTLCIKRPVLLHYFLSIYTLATKGVQVKLDAIFREVLIQIQPTPYEEYAELLRQYLPAYEKLMLDLLERCAFCLYNDPSQYASSKVLIDATWNSFLTEKKLDFLIPFAGVFPMVKVAEILPSLVFELPNEAKLKEVITHFLKCPERIKEEMESEACTAEQLLIFICELQTSGGDQIKRQAGALDLCVDLTGCTPKSSSTEQIFPISVVASVCQRIVEDDSRPIPASFGRLLCTTALHIGALREFLAVTIGPNLIRRRIWEDPQLWRGFKLVMSILWSAQKHHLFQLVLQLPQEPGNGLLQDLQQQHSITTDLAKLVSHDEQARRSCPQYLRILLGLGS